MPQPVYHAYPGNSRAVLAGYALLAAGIILLFICIPGWAWLALVGLLMIVAGWIVLKMCSAWR